MDETLTPEVPRYQPVYFAGETMTAEEAMRKELERLYNLRTNAARLYVEQQGGADSEERAATICAQGMNDGIIPTVLPDGLRSGDSELLLRGNVEPRDLADATLAGLGLQLSRATNTELHAEHGVQSVTMTPGTALTLQRGLTIERTDLLFERNGAFRDKDVADAALAKICDHTPSVEHIAAQLGLTDPEAIKALTAPPPPATYPDHF